MDSNVGHGLFELEAWLASSQNSSSVAAPRYRGAALDATSMEPTNSNNANNNNSLGARTTMENTNIDPSLGGDAGHLPAAAIGNNSRNNNNRVWKRPTIQYVAVEAGAPVPEAPPGYYLSNVNLHNQVWYPGTPPPVAPEGYMIEWKGPLADWKGPL